MWRICRKTICPRWHISRQTPVDTRNQNPHYSKVLILYPASEKKYSNQSSDKKQHTHQKERKYWDDPQFQFNFFHLPILETAGWVGTAAAICLNIHFKHLKNVFEYERPQSSCIFSRNVLAMPKPFSAKPSILLKTPIPVSEPTNVNKIKTDKVFSSADILADIRNLTSQYAAAVENSIGLSHLDKHDKKAFRYFQAAAKLGSSQAFYNLGLCYELGKGTRKNLNRAAFCYKQAAIKGHGLASFNLAIYFFKGIGGFPVDTKTAKLLLKEAAKKGVPEAQLYIGIEYLEERKWFDAVAIFQDLAEKDIPDGQYYLGLCYENGWGVCKNETIAAELFAKSARQGHQKATLKLANYYEEGKGGCHNNYEFACALYQILNDMGNKEGKKALTLLQAKLSGLSKETSLKSEPRKQTSNCSLHTSASVPEFNVAEKTTKLDYTKFLIPSYLNLMTPFMSLKIDIFQQESTFSSGSKEKCIKQYSNGLLPSSFNPLSHALKVKI